MRESDQRLGKGCARCERGAISPSRGEYCNGPEEERGWVGDADHRKSRTPRNGPGTGFG